MCVRARIALVLKLYYLSMIVCQQLKKLCATPTLSGRERLARVRANRAWGVDRWRCRRRL